MTDMPESSIPAPDDQSAIDDADTLPPSHPAGADQTVSAGEVLSGEGPGPAATAAPVDRPSTKP